MKNYNLGKIINKEDRKEWVKNCSNPLYDLNPTIKYILLLLYHIRSFNKLSDKVGFFQIQYCQLNKYMQLLKELGLIDIIPNGRDRTYIITSLGNTLCLDMFDRMKGMHNIKNIKEKQNSGEMK